MIGSGARFVPPFALAETCSGGTRRMEVPGWNSNEKSGHRATLLLRLQTLLAPVTISVVIIFVVLVAFIVIAVPHLVAVPIPLMTISVSIAGLSVSPAAAVIGVVVVPPAVISIMIVSYDALIIAEARVVTKARFVLASPFPIFPLALTAQTVVLDIVIPAFSKPLPVVRIVVSVVAAGAVIRIVSSISVLRASGRHDSPQSQT